MQNNNDNLERFLEIYDKKIEQQNILLLKFKYEITKYCYETADIYKKVSRRTPFDELLIKIFKKKHSYFYLSHLLNIIDMYKDIYSIVLSQLRILEYEILIDIDYYNQITKQESPAL